MAYKKKLTLDLKSVGGQLRATYADAQMITVATEVHKGRIFNIRPSQLPFCPVGFFIRHAMHGRYQVREMGSAFYMGVGTSIHDTVQTHMAQTGKLLADWKCTHCGKIKKFTHDNECCDFPMKYMEVEINYKGVVGHVDAIYKDKSGNYWVVDFKTCSVNKNKTKISPGQDYVQQVETYALMLGLQYGLHIYGVALFFIPRDNPDDPQVWEKVLTGEDYKRIRSRTLEYKRMLAETIAVNSKKGALNLLRYGKCQNPWCELCRKDNVRELILRAYTRGKESEYVPISRLKDSD